MELDCGHVGKGVIVFRGWPFTYTWILLYVVSNIFFVRTCVYNHVCLEYYTFMSHHLIQVPFHRHYLNLPSQSPSPRRLAGNHPTLPVQSDPAVHPLPPQVQM